MWQALCLTAIVLTSCDKTQHEIPEELTQDGAAITVGLNTEAIQGTPLKDAHLYFFNSSETLVEHIYYPNMQELALDRRLMETGYYTVFAVLNTQESCLPTPTRADSKTASSLMANAVVSKAVASKAAVSAISFSDFCQWVKSIDNGTYPHMATGLVRREVKEGLSLITIDVKKVSQAVELSNVTLNLTFPSSYLPDFVATPRSRAASQDVKLRSIIEVYTKSTQELALRKEEFITPTDVERVFTSTLQLTPGKYDLRLWADYTSDPRTDNHYITTDSDIIRILSKTAYRGNTDTRDAFTQIASLDLGTADQSEAITMHRPLAKYRLVATDVTKYEQLRLQRGYPALQDLKITVVYEGFLPNAYSIKNQKPADSDTGYSYASALSEQTQEAATVGADYVLVNGNESFVTVTILFKDAAGKTISGVKGVKVAYRAGQLTTVSGNFLTAGIGGGVVIDTDWSGDYNVSF